MSEDEAVKQLREEAARVCEETAKMVTGKRGELRMPTGPDPEFSDAAFGLAAEVSMVVAKACKVACVWPGQELVWLTAATMLRGGYKRGQRVMMQRPGAPS